MDKIHNARRDNRKIEHIELTPREYSEYRYEMCRYPMSTFMPTNEPHCTFINYSEFQGVKIVCR